MLYNLFENRDFVSVFAVALLVEGVDRNKKFAMSLPGRLTSMVSGYVEPLEARKIERDLQGEVNRQLEAFYLAAVTEIPDKGNGSKPKAPDS